MRQLLLLLSLFVLISCNEADNNASLRNEISVAESSGLGGLLIEDDIEYVEAPLDLDIAPTIATKQQQQVIRTARLRYETQDLEKTKEQIIQAIKNSKGYVQNDNSGKDYNQLYQRLTLRVPNSNFDKALEDIGKGVSYFDERTISQEDVTEEFIDISARLRAKTKLEERYIALLERAKNVKEMLEIERELAKIREEIESKEGRLKYLKDQVSLSTVYVHFYKVTSATGVTVSYGSKMLNALKSGANAISVFFLGLLHLWPFIILVVAVVIFVRRSIKKKKQ